MNEIKVEFIDTSKECISVMKKMMKKSLMNAGKSIKKTLKNDIPVKTGSTKASIRARVEFDKKTGIPTLLIGYSNSKQMLKKGYRHYVNPYWLEFGTKPHQIQTKEFGKGKLNYKLKDSKGTQYGYIVQHPGMKNKNFLRNVVYNNIAEIRQIIEAGIKEINDYQVEQGLIIENEDDEDVE